MDAQDPRPQASVPNAAYIGNTPFAAHVPLAPVRSQQLFEGFKHKHCSRGSIAALHGRLPRPLHRTPRPLVQTSTSTNRYCTSYRGCGLGSGGPRSPDCNRLLSRSISHSCCGLLSSCEHHCGCGRDNWRSPVLPAAINAIIIVALCRGVIGCTHAPITPIAAAIAASGHCINKYFSKGCTAAPEYYRLHQHRCGCTPRGSARERAAGHPNLQKVSHHSGG
mmetsp:Transcript_36235/g.72050  ORF Transcript_36235/g.72050 Transcript_36235/m.72050 type:complete len:221 (+) Transcript_36235:1417-2079(+)